MFKNIIDAIAWVETQPRFKAKGDLSNLKHAFLKLDINLDGIKRIHVAGTNGKGSTSAYLSYILIEKGLLVGSFTSPYLTYFNERIRVNMEPVNDDVLLEYINRMYQFNETLEEKLSFFEIITLLSFKYFSDIKVDIMVIEVGIGGLLDSTNIISYDRSVITNIGLDHMKQLGETKELIANQKLGIIKSSNDMLLSTVSNDLYQQFLEYTTKIKASFNHYTSDLAKTISQIPHIIEYKNKEYEILLGDYQVSNAILAIETIISLYPLTPLEVIYKGLKNTRWAGRLEEISPNVFIDGAHNMHAILALTESLNSLFKGRKLGILFSALGDKEIDKMLISLSEVTSDIIVTSFIDFRYKELSYVENKGFQFIKDPKEAYIALQKMELDAIIITGSIHFIGYIRKMLTTKSK